MDGQNVDYIYALTLGSIKMIDERKKTSKQPHLHVLQAQQALALLEPSELSGLLLTRQRAFSYIEFHVHAHEIMR